MNEIEARSKACLIDELIAELADGMNTDSAFYFIDQVLYTAAMHYIKGFDIDDTESTIKASFVVQKAHSDYINYLSGDDIEEELKRLDERREELIRVYNKTNPMH